ncbi:uncharacterized protein LOC132743551 [Ruditapes philippinarum]|uniref:uncharacterized protein LOC132743551 n=1 Tax=Ruditapes philippinarum TaxID=129788 RepID=UPI00295B8538|nr:uncharacterized protein LOC132743551 [Ruditapes philippinarum]
MLLLKVALIYVLACCLYRDVDAETVKVLTYNTWLHESDNEAIENKDTRRTNIMKSLKSSNADIVCLQEVYIGEDMEFIVDGVKDVFPYSFSNLHTGVSKYEPQATVSRQPPCDNYRLEYLATCLEDNGCNAITTSKENAECAVEYCGLRAYGIFFLDSQECISCIAASWLNLDKCLDTEAVVGGRAINVGGLVLLSKKEIKSVSYTDFHNSTKETLARGYIEAEIKDFATVVCTHLSNKKTDVYFEMDYLNAGITSYKEMNTIEVETLIERFSSVKPSVVMGSFNTGFNRFKKNYKKLYNAFKTKSVTEYTYMDPTDATNVATIDHVFVKGLSINKSKRVFVPVKGETSMSDHAGVQSKLKLN